MVSNLVLRLAWTYKLSPHLRRNHDTVLAFTLLEVLAAHVVPALRACCPMPVMRCWVLFWRRDLLKGITLAKSGRHAA